LKQIEAAWSRGIVDVDAASPDGGSLGMLAALLLDARG
jgi:hypothetical protein